MSKQIEEFKAGENATARAMQVDGEVPVVSWTGADRVSIADAEKMVKALVKAVVAAQGMKMKRDMLKKKS